ncbi:hypothetical protein F5X97DRAFT_157282 [Nemania serpens]|nr:hypothetical protein F5X97DRAFT_157282 [Nemania serpens]
MNNFGVIELASAKTTNAPGWAYVPDRPHHHLATTTTTTSTRKRPRAAASGGAVALSLADANARQEAKARREIEILDRDNAREAQVAIPPKPGASRTAAGGAGAGASGKKYTPNVRRILQSQKTFANHLDDYVALLSQQPEVANPYPGSNSNPTPTPAATAHANLNPNLGAAALASTTQGTADPPSRRRASQKPNHPPPSKKPAAKPDPDAMEIDMPGVPSAHAPPPPPPDPPRSAILTPYAPFPAHAEDANPLLASRVPPLPSDDELRALLAAPALSYLEARGTWPPGGNRQRYPTRLFCAVCGYWGRVRCIKCGTRVCALECLETHQEECITRYGL